MSAVQLLCPVCEVPIRFGMLMCRSDWALVAPKTRREVNSSYRALRQITKEQYPKFGEMRRRYEAAANLAVDEAKQA